MALPLVFLALHKQKDLLVYDLMRLECMLCAYYTLPQFLTVFFTIFLRFSRTLNNCKVPQIRYATPERLLQRLTDLRFLSIDFLNTFLLTYRVFADGVQVKEK